MDSTANREPSQEEVMAMLAELQKLGESDASQLPPELQELMQHAKLQSQQSGAASDMPTEEIDPNPGFVVKTQDETGRKVFINMVGHDKVAAPGNWSSGVLPDEVQQALDNIDNLSQEQAEALRFPLSMSAPRTELDKQGQPATTYDCCLNQDVINMCGGYRQLKAFIIELAINWINHKHKMQLDPKYKLPKMKYKGEQVETQRIRVDRKKLVTEVKDIPEDPVFPLLTKKPPPGKTVVPPPGATGNAASSKAPGAAPSGATPSGGPPADNGHTAVSNAQPGISTSGSTSTFSFDSQQKRMFKQVGQVQMQGKPVQSMRVEIEMPASLSPALATQAQTDLQQAYQVMLSNTKLEVSGQKLHIAAPGCGDLTVALPLAATPSGAQVSLDARRTPLPVLLVEVQVMSGTQYAAECRSGAPHAPGSLHFSSASTALELEP